MKSKFVSIEKDEDGYTLIVHETYTVVRNLMYYIGYYKEFPQFLYNKNTVEDLKKYALSRRREYIEHLKLHKQHITAPGGFSL